MIAVQQSGAVRWLALALLATGGFAALGASLTWSAEQAQGTSYHGASYFDRGFLDFTPEGTQPGLLSAMEPPSSCFSCHRDFVPGSAASGFMPSNTWGGSMMAHATRDPLFWAALDVAEADMPGVGDYCLRCHTPTAWLEGRVRKTVDGGIIQGTNGCELTGNHTAFDSSGNDYAGLTCHFCHRLTETGPNGEVAALENANFWIDDAESCTTADGQVYAGPCRHGPYHYSADDPRTPSHGWVYSAFLDRGAVCGTCHDVSTPFTSDGPFKTLMLPDGSDSGIPMPIERTFSEWGSSDYRDLIFRDRLGDDFAFEPPLARGATCQDCHMANSEDPTARACSNNDDGSRAGDLPVHEFVGANTWVPAIIRGEYGPGLSMVEDRIEDLARTIDRARNMLTQRSAVIETTVLPPAPGSSQLHASIKVTNLAGHKLPTGYAEGRRMWLHVVARDGGGNVLWQNGNWDPATGALDYDGQTRIYETLQGIWNASTQTCELEDGLGRKQFHFVLNNCIAKDNRIPPLGFTAGDSLEMRPVGLSYPETAPGSGRLVNYDVADYVIPLPPGTTGTVSVTATLKFQIASDDYIKFLKNQADERGFLAENTMCVDGPDRPFSVGPQDKTRGQFVYDLWSDPLYGRSPPEDMVSASDHATLP